jgi:hypothetical protein
MSRGIAISGQIVLSFLQAGFIPAKHVLCYENTV